MPKSQPAGKIVYHAQHLQEAHFLKDQIEAAQIPCTILNEHTYNLRGEVPMSHDTLPAIQVFSDSDIVKAKKVIQEFESSRRATSTETCNWICHQCSETNPGNFSLCWNCGSYYSGAKVEIPQDTDRPEPHKPSFTQKGNLGRYFISLIILGIGILLGYYLSQWGIIPESRTQVVKDDLNQDGIIDRITYFYSDGAARTDEDFNSDGKVDNRTFFNQFGKAVKSERDFNFDNRVDNWTYYNDIGLAGKIEKDLNFDGSVDAIYTYQYENGVLTKSQSSPSHNNTPVLETYFKYEVPHYELIDDNGDGEFDYRLDYDNFGRPVNKPNNSNFGRNHKKR